MGDLDDVFPSEQVYLIFGGGGTANGCCFGLAGLAYVVDADVVLVWFEDLVKLVTQGDEFFVVEEAFEHAELGPLAVATKDFVDFGTAAVVGDVVSDQVHGRCCEV